MSLKFKVELCHGNEEWCKIWRGIDLSVQNWHVEFDKFWPEHSKISNIYTLTDCFWPKYLMFELKKYRGVMFGGSEYWFKIWTKNDVRNLPNFYQNTFENLKIGTLMGSFYPFIYSRAVLWQWRMMQNLKKNWLVTSKLTCEIWRILTQSLRNHKNLQFNGLLLTKVFNVWAKKSVEELCLMVL